MVKRIYFRKIFQKSNSKSKQISVDNSQIRGSVLLALKKTYAHSNMDSESQ